MFIHVFFLFPETAGKTLEETENMFEDPSGPKYIGTLAWKTRVDRHASMLEHGEFDPEAKRGSFGARHVEGGEKNATAGTEAQRAASDSDAATATA